MILAALEAEVEEYRQRHRDARDARGHALVVRNGAARPRRLTVGAGPSRSRRHAFMINGSSTASGRNSRVGSFRPMCAAPRR
jgi:hypothetical protein